MKNRLHVSFIEDKVRLSPGDFIVGNYTFFFFKRKCCKRERKEVEPLLPLLRNSNLGKVGI